ncbi:MAG: hypothetical protein KGL53_05210, partial [Elusimicrobia bacterium]|nr:hypothetical protein [Elusimicrobiota bacterium]
YRQGAFSLTFTSQVGRSKTVGLLWRIKGEPGGAMQLEKKGALFVLSETDPGFGVGAEEMDPITITPSR